MKIDKRKRDRQKGRVSFIINKRKKNHDLILKRNDKVKIHLFIEPNV
jgi:hypothetical protein